MKVLFTIALALLGALLAPAAQFVEVVTDYAVTAWRYHEETGLPLKTERAFTARCVVGTNLWFMENQVRSNITESLWFTDGKIVRQIAYQPTVIEDDGAITSYRRRPSIGVAASADGYPGYDFTINVPWFAYCSGPYLRKAGRAVPLPAPEQGKPAFGYSDETTTFPDTLGLPQRVTLYNARRQVKCEYQMQASTNLLGWNIPTTFTLTQNDPNSFGRMQKSLTVTGRLRVIKPAPRYEIPEDVLERLADAELRNSRSK